MKRILGTLLAMLAAGGVGTLQGQKPDGERVAAFWGTLGDTTLQRLVGDVVKSNEDVAAARARLRSTQATRLHAQLDFAPTVTVASSYTRQRLASAGFPQGGSFVFPDQNVWDAGVQLAWELDLFGKIRRTAQGQGALVTAAQEDIEDVQVLLTAELAIEYFDLRGAQDRLAVAQRNAENQRRTLDVTSERLDAGKGNSFDTERAKAQLNSTLAAVPALEASITVIQHRIGVLVGRSDAHVDEALVEPRPRPTLPESIAVANVETIVRQRPDVRSAERQVAAGGAFVGAAKAAYLPRLTIGGGAGYVSNTFQSLNDVEKPRYALSAVVSWPALNLGRVKADVDLAQAQDAEAEARYRKARLQAFEEIGSSVVAYNKARLSLKYLDAAASASERAAALARLRFEEGASDFLQVLDAERTMLEAQDRLSTGRTTATRLLVAVYRALGGAPLSR